MVVAAGAALMTVEALEPSKKPHSIWANTWFDVGFACLIAGLVIAAVGLYLHLRHRRMPSTVPAGRMNPPASARQPDPADWVVSCDESPDHTTLVFNLRHRFDNPGAIHTFSEFKCGVTDPNGVHTESVGHSLFRQYHPAFFPAAPPIRNGKYRFIWAGRDAKGAWQQLAEGAYEVIGLPPLIVTILDSRFETWRWIAQIAALHVQVENTTDKPILVATYGFGCNNEGRPLWQEQASHDEQLSVDREIHRRQERQEYGQPLRNYARIQPHQRISGWLVTCVSRNPAGGTPQCTVTVKDDIGNQYTTVLPKQGPQAYIS